MLRVARAHLTDDGLRALAHARRPTAAPMSPDDIARLLLLLRRSRALRRRGAHTKAVRRARAREMGLDPRGVDLLALLPA